MLAKLKLRGIANRWGLTALAFAYWLPVFAAPVESLSLRNSADVETAVEHVLTRADENFSDADPPVLIFLHDPNTPWTRLQQALAAALSRYGISVKGLAVPEFDPLSLEDAPGFLLGLDVQDRGSKWERAKDWTAAQFGLQHVRKNNADRRAFYRGEGQHRFRWTNTVPRGFGGGWKRQSIYLGIATGNTATFAAVNSVHGTAEALCFALTYLFNAGADYIRWNAQLGRNPRWEWNSETQQRELVTTLAKTFNRKFSFLVTWGVIGGSNLIIVLPIMAHGGEAAIGPLLWRVLTNSLTSVWALVPSQDYFARVRVEQLTAEKMLEEIEHRLAEKGEILDVEERSQLEEQVRLLKSQAGRAQLKFDGGRLVYYGWVFSTIKNNHLLNQGEVRLILVTIGAVGLVVDVYKNGTRLGWSRTWKPSGEGQCPTYLAAGTASQIEAVSERLRSSP